jgi:DNA polymerase
MGMGPTPCEVMFIGEAPGHREDDINKPFQGDAGRVLEECLSAAGIDRKSIYITNTVRCRPPANRKPKNNEIKACHYWMEEELKRVKPKYIVPLGATAIKNFDELRKSKITQVRGRFFRIGKYEVFPVFHPASVLYDESKRATLKADLMTFFKAISGKDVKESKSFNVKLVNSKESLPR